MQVLDDKEIDIACISETWFDSKTGKFTPTIRESGFKIGHDCRENKRGEGSAIIYKQSLKVKPGEASCSKYELFEYSSHLMSH